MGKIVTIANQKDIILSIGGFDATEGAGINIASRICQSLKIPHVSIISTVVLQDQQQVYKKINLSLKDISRQIEKIHPYCLAKIVNIGVLGDVKIFPFIIDRLGCSQLILDPVFSSGSGQFSFYNSKEIGYVGSFFQHLFLLTPNIPEAEILCYFSIKDLNDMKKAVYKLKECYGVSNILLKGGHLKRKYAVDVLLTEEKIHLFRSVMFHRRIHGTGSFLNAAISAFLFSGDSLVMSVKKAKLMLAKACRNLDLDYPILSP